MASVTEQLKDLADLLERELITREEFDEQKRKLLTDPGSGGIPAGSDSSPPTTDTSDLTGHRIGEYRLERKLGEGGMGQVYLGAHETLDQRVAVKVLDAALARNPEVRTRFIQEANIQIKLQHPGIVRVLTAHTQGEHLALVMEYVEGLSLEQALERRGRLPLDRMLPLMAQVLDAVGYAHERGVVHRDLKPSNIMVQPDGTAKVMDFGIAKVLGGAKLTRTGTLMGTAFYMSPEQVLGRTDIDHRTDIYSLGVTFFEALTGRVPFEGKGDENTDSDYLIKDAHVRTAPPDPCTVQPGLPEWAAQALLQALEKEPARRFKSCGDFANSFERAGHYPAPTDTSSPGIARRTGGDDVVPVLSEETSPRVRNGTPRPSSSEPTRGGHGKGITSRGYRMVEIEAGEFTMGSPPGEMGRGDGETQHRVQIMRPFLIGVAPVPQSLYEAVVGRNPSHFKEGARPVELISWYDAVAFCNRLSAQEGLAPAYTITDQSVTWDRSDDGYRLPTEAEWEYAARGGQTHVYAGSDQLNDLAWFSGNSGYRTHAVHKKQPNAWGLYDMSGNVWEWVWDWQGEYPAGDVTDPTGPAKGAYRVLRGGSWNDNPRCSRVAARNGCTPGLRSYAAGFRLARSIT